MISRTFILAIVAFLLLVVLQIIRKIFAYRFLSGYNKRDRVMNISERKFYILLQKILGDKYIVLSKVRIEDFVNVGSNFSSWGEKQSLRGKIKSRHVDFLICDFLTTKPLLAIELDGPMHMKADRIERDKFVDVLYSKIGLPFEHVQVGGNFAKEIEKIKDRL